MSAPRLHAAADESQARIVGHVDLARVTDKQLSGEAGSDFLSILAKSPWSGDRVRSELDRVLSEIQELQAENRWQDILAIFHPVDEKLSELVASGMATEVYQKIGFVLGRAGRHDEALSCLSAIALEEPDNHMTHYTIAYTVLDALFTARTSRQVMTHAKKKQLIAKGHEHFKEACRLRPDSVTFFYRHGILYKEIENKSKLAIPMFQKAIANWEALNEETRKVQHQQYPKYIKAMYHLASCFLADGQMESSLHLLERLLELDHDRNHMHPVFKHFAMGKILHSLGKPKQALEHLDVAVCRSDYGGKRQPVDFVFELAARCCLLLKKPQRAAAYINKVPQPKRRPYIIWTEADTMVALGETEKAVKILAATAERDRKSRHKSLIRMARIHFACGKYKEAERLSTEAVEFCRNTFGNPSHEAMFWMAAALCRLDKSDKALRIVETLEEHRFSYPHFRNLAQLVRSMESDRQKDNYRLSLIKSK